jgi:hypothetical protein
VLVSASRRNSLHRKVYDREDAIANTRDACAIRIRGTQTFQTFQSVRPAEFYSAGGLLRAAGLETRWAHRPKARVPAVVNS